MAVTVSQFAYAIQASADGTNLLPELSERLSRLLGTATATVDLLAPGAPDDVKDSAVISMAGYLYDQPPAGRLSSFANAFTNSGAGSLVAFWTPKGFADSSGTVLHPTPGGMGTGGLSEAEALALMALWARAGNDDQIPAEKLTLAPSSSGTDSVARAAAAAAQSEIDTHEASTHNTDITARSTARNARQDGGAGANRTGDSPEFNA